MDSSVAHGVSAAICGSPKKTSSGTADSDARTEAKRSVPDTALLDGVVRPRDVSLREAGPSDVVSGAAALASWPTGALDRPGLSAAAWLHPASAEAAKQASR
jgi:hypothetical protein